MSEETKSQIEELVNSDRIVVFMKGSRSFPQCGFSATVVQILNSLVPEYKTINVLADPNIRQGIKDYSSWPTIPQLYVGGEFVGGCDIVKEMFASGELHGVLGVDKVDVPAPDITISESAAEQLRQALTEAGPDDHIRLSVGPRFQHDLSLSPKQPGDVEVESAGLTLLVDPLSAPKAAGITIDFVTQDGASGFRIDNPNAPSLKPAT